MSTPKGVRSVNENIVQPGRAFIITDMTDIAWDQIPDGSLFINPVSGIMQVKLAGETTWTPAGIKNDGTLCIARDTSLHVETFTITSLDNGDGTFTYVNEDGEQRYKQFDNNGYVFELEHGSYIPGRNHITIILDDVLERSVVSGGIQELDSIRFKLLEKVPVGTELTVKYINWVRIGNPYPRVYEGYDDPEEAEIGDFFMDYDDTIDGLGDLTDETTTEISIPWSSITGKPTTIAGYKIQDPISYNPHTHTIEQIEGLTNRLQQLQTKNTQLEQQIASLTNTINSLQTRLGSVETKTNKLPEIYIQTSTPSGATNNKAVWFNMTGNAEQIRVLWNSAWKNMGAVWK